MSDLYFNEFDPFAAAWIRELMTDGHIPAGTVDERSIKDVAADDLRGFGQCHFFAGIGGWPLALDLAGWGDRPVWSGSAPCQPYSSAGKRQGNADARDLWPDFFRLIRECRPECVFGEQVEAAIRHGWLDRVRADLEGEGYTVGAVVLGAHSAGAPHIRQRLYWVAHLPGVRRGERQHGGGVDEATSGTSGRERLPVPDGSGSVRPVDGLAHAERKRDGDDRRGATGGAAAGVQGADGERQRVRADARECRRVVFDFSAPDGRSIETLRAQGAFCPSDELIAICERASGFARSRGLADADGRLSGDGGVQPGREHGQQPEDGGTAGGVADHSGDRLEGGGEPSGAHAGREAARGGGQRPSDDCPPDGVAQGDAVSDRPQGQHEAGAAPGPVVGADGGFWADSRLILCRDGKRRRIPTQPGLFPLAAGLSGRVAVVRAGQQPEAANPEEVRYANRVGALRGAGNAICVPTAVAFVRAFLEAESDLT